MKRIFDGYVRSKVTLRSIVVIVHRMQGHSPRVFTSGIVVRANYTPGLSSAYATDQRWCLIPGTPFENTPSLFPANTAPLLKEEGDASREALIADVNDPLLRHWPRSRP